jgi:CDP-4-dehydro-6-deoxyglucose reductase
MPWKWYESRVVEIVNLTAHTKSFWLKIMDGQSFDFRPGQFITLDLPIHEKRHKRWRSYSIANLPGKDGLIELCIVSLENGLATHYLFNELMVGDTIRFKGPDGNFIITKSMENKDLVMICTGTGVAPFRSMLLARHAEGVFNRPAHLIFGTRLQSDILYQKDFRQLEAQEPLFKYTVTLSRDEQWPGHRGYVHSIYMSEYQEVSEDRLFLLCGWSKMIDEAVANLIIKLGYDKSQVRYELYG